MTTYTTPTDWKAEGWWRNRKADERLFHLKAPKRTRKYDFMNLDLPDQIISQARDWVTNYSPGDCLLIHGRVGSGKTTLAQVITKELVTARPLSGRFVSSDMYIDMLQDSFNHNNELPEMYSTPHLLKYLNGVFDIVVLDGVGHERNTEFTRHEIGSLIRRRYEDERSIIITTSLSPTDFLNHYGDRVKLALSDMAQINVKF